MRDTTCQLDEVHRGPSPLTVAICIPFGLGIWFVPLYWAEILGFITALAIIIVIVALFCDLSQVFLRANERRVFIASTEHTYDTNCPVCGEDFGWNYQQTHPLADPPQHYQKMYICRRDKEQVTYTV